MYGLMAAVLANYLTKKQLRLPRESSTYSAVTTSCRNKHGPREDGANLKCLCRDDEPEAQDTPCMHHSAASAT